MQSISLGRTIPSFLFVLLALFWSAGAALYLLKYWFLFAAGFPTRLVTLSLVLSLGLISIFGIFCKNQRKISIAIVLISSIGTLLLLEAAHYWHTYYPGFPDLSPPIEVSQEQVENSQRQGIWLDKRSKIEVISNLRVRGLAAYPAFLVTNRAAWDSDLDYYLSNPLPLGSISDSTIVHCNESGKWSIYESDEKGFNNPRGVWDLPEDGIDAILLGDSFVHGACVDPGEDLGSWIRHHLPNTVNLGQRGNGPLLQLAGLREYGAFLEPKYVFWFYTENNDLDNLRFEFSSPFLKNYLTPDFSQNLIKRTREIDRFVRDFTEYNYKVAKLIAAPTFLDHIRYILTLRSIRKRLSLETTGRPDPTSEWKLLHGLYLLATHGPSNVDPKEQSSPPTSDVSMDWYSIFGKELPHYSLILQQAKREVAEWGGELIFIFLPEGGRYVFPSDPVFQLKSDVFEMVLKLDIPIIDGDEVIGQGDYARFFPGRGGHYNALGYETIADHIFHNLNVHD